jgi:NADPH2:quinone reductase
MKALIVDKFGLPRAAHFGETAQPKPGPGQLLVRVRAAAVNPADFKRMTGLMQDVSPMSFPYVPGTDGAGVVTDVGSDVGGWRSGDAVLGMFETGTLAEYALISASSERLARKRENLDFLHAAAILVAGLTATTILRAANVRTGQSILLIGATGGIGLFATQLAKARGAQVIATARPADEAYLRGLGADEIIDYVTGDPVAKVRERHPDGVDIVVDLIKSGDALLHDADALRATGTLVSSLSGPAKSAFRPGVTVRYILMTANAGDLQELADQVATGKLKVELGRTYDFSQAAQALADINDPAKHTRGKSVVRAP